MPNFLIIGVGKSGTTSLYYALKQHPQIFMSPTKEPRFFYYGERKFEGFGGPVSTTNFVSTLSEYLSLFIGVTDETAIGEASVNNFFPRACARIKHYIPDAKLIAILRQPADRAYSQFTHAHREGVEPLADFAQALQSEKTRRHQNWWVFLRYREQSFYYSSLKEYFAHFRREQFRIYLYEEWCSRSLEVLRDIFRFLGVDENFVPDMSVRHNQGMHNRSPALHHFLTRSHPLKSLVKPFVPPAWRPGLV
jgi:hypothetical protein